MNSWGKIYGLSNGLDAPEHKTVDRRPIKLVEIFGY